MQKSLAEQVIIEGIGVHSGSFSSLCISPAPCNSGIVFKNSLFPDLQEFLSVGSVIPEVAMHATVIRAPSWSLSTVEHLMAACSFLGLDNLEIVITGFEVPILDGSALPFLQVFESVGIVEQDANKLYLTPREPIVIQDSQGRFIQIVPHNDHSDLSLFLELAPS